MNTSLPMSSPDSASPSGNPHVLWRQLLGFVFWVVLFSLPGRLPGVVLCLALGGATFADAWKSGIYKRPGVRSFLNISPMAWGIAMAALFPITYPMYLLNRNKLRTIHGTDAYYWIAVALGVLVILLLVASILARFGGQ
jgi:hypothetical protein